MNSRMADVMIFNGLVKGISCPAENLLQNLRSPLKSGIKKTKKQNKTQTKKKPHFIAYPRVSPVFVCEQPSSDMRISTT